MRRSKILPSLALLAAFGLTLSFALWTGSRAWLSANHSVSATGMRIRAELPPTVAVTCTVHSLAERDGELLFFNQEPEPGTSGGVALDCYRTDGSEQTPKLLRFRVKTDASSRTNALPALTLRAVSQAERGMNGTDYRIIRYVNGANGDRIRVDDNLPAGSPAPTYDNSISSIIAFAPAEPVTDTASSGTPCYALEAATVTADTRKTFVSLSHTREFTRTVDLYTTRATEEGSTELEFFILVSYDAELVAELFARNLGNGNLYADTAGTGIDFLNDFTFELTVAP